MRPVSGGAPGNALYDLAREKFLGGDLDWDAQVFKAMLVDGADYVPNLATHDFLDDVPVGGREETSAALANKTKTIGVADADNVTFTAAAGDPCEYLLLFRDTGVAATSELVALFDTWTGASNPVILNGGDVVVAWDSGANKIFKL